MVEVYYLDWDGGNRFMVDDVRSGEIRPDGDFVDEHYFHALSVDVDDDEEHVLEAVWSRLNRDPRGYDRRLDDEELRSMSVGDIVVVDDVAYIAASIGFEELGELDL